MSAVLVAAQPHRIKRSHRRRGKVTSGRFVQRYYDPIIGRFLSVDPVETDPNTGASFNRYAYANNNPYRFTDPDGRATKDPFHDKTRDLGPNYVGRIDKVPNSSIYELHVYKTGGDFDDAIKNNDKQLLRKQEVGVVGPDGEWINKHDHTKAPTITATANAKIRSVVATEARRSGFLGPRGSVNIKGSNLKEAIQTGMKRSGSFQYLKSLGKALGPATVITGYFENLSDVKACGFDPDFDGC
ncbi:MAG: RHS repeat-associated core domain-containing protein [Arenimonas sp.]